MCVCGTVRALCDFQLASDSNYVHFACSKIRLRQQAVSELIQSEKPSLFLLKATLLKLPDLEQKLCSAHHKKVCA